MVKSPLNRELVATYEVTLSVIDNASDLPERSVSVPNGKAPPGISCGLLRARQGRWGASTDLAPGREQRDPLTAGAASRQAIRTA